MEHRRRIRPRRTTTMGLRVRVEAGAVGRVVSAMRVVLVLE
jgi:hypothetical protein